MERSKRNWALRLAVGLVVVAGAFLASMSGFAEREGVSFTATLYSDVIRFEADGVASLRVTVYDLAENELWSSGQVMGDFVDWDRANERGERLANGYYLYLAQGWDGSDALILNKAGKVVLLPGDQVELRAAPTTGGITFENPDITFGTKAVGETAYYSYIDLSGVNYPQYIMLSDLGGAHQWSFFGSSAGFYIRDRTVARNPFAILNSAPNNALVLDGSGYLKLSQSNYPQYIMKSNLGGAHEWSFFGADTGYYIRDRTAGLNSFGIQNSAPANSLIIQSDGNVGIGTASPGQELDVAGDINITGFLYRNGTTLVHNDATDYNTFVGRAAGNLTISGSGNTGVGDSALSSLASGNGNTALGENALILNTTGHFNTAIGNDAMFGNVGGGNNTAVGDDVLVANTEGDANTAVGKNALEDNVDDNNTAVGCDALLDLSSGSNNTALGHTAGQYCTSGSHNVYISNGGTSESNTTRIGDANQTRTFISGIYGVAIAGGTQVVVDANGQLGNGSISSRAAKRNIANIGASSRFLYDLRPVSFLYREEIDPVGIPQYGLIAEEVAEVAPELVLTDEAGDPMMVRYELLAPLLLNELQEQRELIETQQSRIDALLERLEALEQEVRD